MRLAPPPSRAVLPWVTNSLNRHAIAALALAACLTCFCRPLNVESAEPRPNVLLICVDDLKPLLGCYGDDRVHSPNIDRLAALGMLFERAYCNQAVCAPSRNTLLTGKRPDSLGIYDLGTNFRAAMPDAITLPQHFKANGYRVEGLGKIFHVGHGNHEDPASWSVPHWPAAVIAYALPRSRAEQGLTREEALFANRSTPLSSAVNFDSTPACPLAGSQGPGRRNGAALNLVAGAQARVKAQGGPHSAPAHVASERAHYFAPSTSA